MKKILFSLIFILSLCTFTSCDIDNSNDYYVFPPYVTAWYWQPKQNSSGQWLMGGPINSYSAGVKAQTRAYTIQTSDVISNYDNFSLFGWTPDSTVMDNYEGTINHQTYTWGYTTAQKYFDNNVAKYSFMGIIPYTNTLTLKNDNTVDVTLDDFTTEGVNPNDEKYNKEFIIASTEVEKANYSQGATLNFYHQNSIVRIKFETENTNALEILDFTPYTPEVPYQPAVPGTQTTTTKSGKAIDMLYAGEIVYWPYEGDANLSASQANNFYKNTSNYGNMGSLMGAVNAQFVYYNTSGSVTTNAWVEGSAKKNMYGIQLASTTNKDDFVGGTTEDTWKDAFWTNASTQIKDLFRKSYSEGWRVIRIENIAGTQYDAWLLNNTEMTYKVITTTGGSPEVPYQPATGKNGIVVLPATSANQTGKDAALSTFPTNVTANVSLSGVTYSTNSTVAEMVFTKPGAVAYSVYSPTNWYTFPVTHDATFGFTIKFSYKIDLGNTGTYVTRYDARVFVPATKCNWQPGKWYDYVIKVNSDKHGKVDPNEADETDPKIEEEFPIIVNSSPANIDTFIEGEIWEFSL